MTDLPEHHPDPLAPEREPGVTGSIYLSRTEAAQYLNLPASWLANNTRTGPRFIKLGRHVRYSVAALDSFMSAHEKGAR